MKEWKRGLYVVTTVLLGVLSQVRAGEVDGKYYSRPYSVLSANVGNSDLRAKKGRYKLRVNSREEARVRFWIRKLQPDIVILLETSNRKQADSLLADGYSIQGGPYDFICLKKEIGDVIKHEQMNERQGDSVGYVDVALKNEEARKVRLFYVHFPSPGKRLSIFSPKVVEAHIYGFGWVENKITEASAFGIPCLIAGDLNNDFLRYRQEKSFKPISWAANFIYEQVARDNLWIFNPPSDGGLKDDYYEGTYRIEEMLGRQRTIDWVMGKNVIPPAQLPGISPLSKGRDCSFVTSPPDWWKAKSAFIFDHKPLYGKVVFYWEKEKIWKEYRVGDLLVSIPPDWFGVVRDFKKEPHPAPEIKGFQIMGEYGFLAFPKITDFEDKKYLLFQISGGKAEPPFDKVEPGKWRIIHYGEGEKRIEEPGTTSKTITIRHLGKLVDSFQAKIADQKVTVCLLRPNEEFTHFSIAFLKPGKYYAITLTGRDFDYLKKILNQLLSQILYRPKKDDKDFLITPPIKGRVKEPFPSEILGTYILKDQMSPDYQSIIELKSDGTAFVGGVVKWEIIEEKEVAKVILKFPSFPLHKGVVGEETISYSVGTKFRKIEGAKLMRNFKQGKLWSEYLDPKTSLLLKFQEDGTCRVGNELQWRLEDETLTFSLGQTVFLSYKLKDGTIIGDGGAVYLKKD